MLQRFATRSWQKAGYFAALTLLAGGSFLWSNKSIAHKEEKNGNIITFNGNKFETGVPPLKLADGRLSKGNDIRVSFAQAVPDGAATDVKSNAAGNPSGVTVSRAKPSGPTFTAQLAAMPLKMNGAPIFRTGDLDQQASLPDGTNLEKRLIEQEMPSLSKLPDGQYTLSLQQVISDAGGNIVYYKAGGVDWYAAVKPGTRSLNFGEAMAQAEKEAKAHAVDAALQAKLTKEMEAALESISLSPAQKGGRPVIAYVESRNATTLYIADIRNGKVTAVNKAMD